MVPRCQEYVLRDCGECGKKYRWKCGRVLTTDGECENFDKHVAVVVIEEVKGSGSGS